MTTPTPMLSPEEWAKVPPMAHRETWGYMAGHHWMIDTLRWEFYHHPASLSPAGYAEAELVIRRQQVLRTLAALAA